MSNDMYMSRCMYMSPCMYMWPCMYMSGHMDVAPGAGPGEPRSGWDSFAVTCQPVSRLGRHRVARTAGMGLREWSVAMGEGPASAALGQRKAMWRRAGGLTAALALALSLTAPLARSQD